MNGFQVVQPGQTRTRHRRQPTFPIAGGMRPFGLYPVAFTPVLPGETLSEAHLRETVVSSPVVSPLSGAWLETWSCYVKLTDIDRELGGMFIGQLNDPTAYLAAADRPRYFTKSGQLDWCYMAARTVYRHFFLDEQEAETETDGVFKLKRIVKDFTESAMMKSDLADQPVPAAQEEVTPQLQAYLQMRQMGMSALSYEDYLKQYGVSTVQVEEGEPELLSYRRYWTGPSNVLDPQTGAPTGSFYWRIDEKQSKAKMFKEPGFVIMLQAVRPKLFDATQVASASNNLWGFQDWMPSYTLADPSAGIRELDPATQTIFENVGTAGSEKAWIDHRDLLSHGEQFINGASRFSAPVTTGRSFADGALPQEVRGQYVPEADIDALFTSTEASERVVDYEGIVSMDFKGHIKDTT